MADPTITTTNGEQFTLKDHAKMAYMIYVRFGRDMASACAAWRRMLQNSTEEYEFAGLVEMGGGAVMDDAGIRAALNELGTAMTGKQPLGAPSRITIEDFIGGEMFYCSHDGGYTRFQFKVPNHPTTEHVGTVGWIWNGERGDDYRKRATAWESPKVLALRKRVETDMAWAARFLGWVEGVE
jgi:hypothetical protein